MPRRPRRANTSSAAMSPGDDDDAGDTLTVEYRFSPGKVFHLIEQLSEEQEELVRSIGLGGLLDLPRYDKLDRHFSAWLFNQVISTGTDALAAAAAAFMSDGGGTKVPVTARDVHEVLGVPHGPRQVGLGGTKEDVAAVRQALGLNPHERQAVTLTDVKRVLDELTAPPPPSSSRRPMTPFERDRFVVAFLVFVVGHFLAPRGLREHTNDEVFHALANPSEVGQFDWAGYVLRQLLDCAGRVRRQLAGGGVSKSKIELSGVRMPPLPPGFYLERLDSVRPQPERWPRIAAYDRETLRAHVEQDRRPVRREGGLKPFGKLRFVAPNCLRIPRNCRGDGRGHGPRPPAAPPPPRVQHSDPTMSQQMACQSLPKQNRQRTRARTPARETLANYLAACREERKYVAEGHWLHGAQYCYFVTAKDPERPMSPVTQPENSNSTRTRDLYLCSDFIMTKNPQEHLISQEAPTDASGTTTTRGSQLSFNSASNHCEGTDTDDDEEYEMDEDEEYEIFKRFYQMRKRRRGRKHSYRNQVSQLPIDERDLLAVEGVNDRSAFMTLAPNRSPHVQGGPKLEDIFVPRKPRTGLEGMALPSEKIRISKFHIEEITRQAYHNLVQSDSPGSGKHQVVQPTYSQSNLYQPSNVVIDLDPDQSDEKDVAYETENEPSNKRQRVHARSPKKDANACFLWVKSCAKDNEQLKWAWIIHNKPTPIEITGESIRSQFVLGSSLKQDICNLMMRMFMELDDTIYLNSEPRQRHFLPADWAALALEHGSNLITESSPTVRSMFSGPHIIYDVKLCRMVIVPVQCRKGEWSCYVWDFKEKRLTILDPLINQSGTNEQDVHARHDSIKHVLHGALIACRSKYCSSSCRYDLDHEESSSNEWNIFFLRGLGGKHVMSHNSGIYTLHFAREFDGTKLEAVGKIDELRKELLYELLAMTSNTGRLPPTLPIRERAQLYAALSRDP